MRVATLAIVAAAVLFALAACNEPTDPPLRDAGTPDVSDELPDSAPPLGSDFDASP